MKTKHQLTRHFTAVACAILLVSGTTPLSAQTQTTQQSVQIPPDQLDSLVAPIALFPDELLSQTLVASTYPLELMQLQQWLQRNPGLKDKALADAVAKQQWDPSIQAMAALPDLVKRLTNDIQWTTDLGNAFLAEQSGVMNAIQRMRVKAQGTGTLTSNQHQRVENEVVDGRTVVVVEQANPEVVYVPSYNPEAVYGPPEYPYPDIYYPSYSGVVAASAISWGVGVAMGAAWGGGWGWGFGWGHNDIDVNWNNNFNRNEWNRADFNRANFTGANRNNWQHNPQHRGGTPYADHRTANRFGSNTRGDSLASRQKLAQQQITRQKGNLGSVSGGARPGGGAIGGGARPGGGGAIGGGARPGGGGAIGGGVRPGGGAVGGGVRPGGGGAVGGGVRPGGGGVRPGGGGAIDGGVRPGGG
ncbi:MAG TPA: DUF3300 domain-containing protein, partial [Verrucomicrobiae bacterium]|nr:DUF3300 domain-containing protein [Verrucomicrobiae bacterium]